MKTSIVRLIAIIPFLFQLQSAICQSGKANHTFKITGNERIPVYIGDSEERLVEYDPDSKDHLYISDFRKNGSLLEKTRFRFYGEKFNLTNLSDYIDKRGLLRDGAQYKCREDGSVASELIYKDDILRQQTVYYLNGNKQLFFESKDNILNGPLKMWHQDGKLSFSGTYKNNQKDGLFESFDQSGNPDRKGIYEDGKLISGESVVQDLVYDKPDVPAQYIGGDVAFNNYLKLKTADFASVKEMVEGVARDISLRLTINKTGQIIKWKIISLALTSDDEMIHAVFNEINGFKPALLEGVPVRSILNLNLILSNQGLGTKFNTIDSTIETNTKTNNDSINKPVYFIVEEMPEFPGGQLALRNFIAQQMRYPVYAQEHGIQGKVFVSFVIIEDGSISRIRIARSVHPLLDAEAIRVVKQLPKWIPGRLNGKAVKVSYTVPMNFVLQ